MAKQALRSLLNAIWPQRRGAWLGLAVSRAGNFANAEDLVHEALLRTLQADPKIESAAEADAYIRTAIRRTAVDTYRRAAVRTAALQDLRADSCMLERFRARDPLSLETLLESRAAYALIQARLARMAPELRETVHLYFLQEMGLREIAELHGVSTAAVHARLNRAIDELGDALADSTGARQPE